MTTFTYDDLVIGVGPIRSTAARAYRRHLPRSIQITTARSMLAEAKRSVKISVYSSDSEYVRRQSHFMMRKNPQTNDNVLVPGVQKP